MEHLFSEFNPANSADWKARLEKDLKGVGFSDLQVTDRNGITINPFYTTEDWPRTSEPIFRHPDWEICSSITVTDPAIANKQALEALEGGASGLCFILNEVPDLAVLLQDIGIRFIYLHFRLTTALPEFAPAFRTYVNSLDIRFQELNCSIAYDPVYQLLKNGDIHIDTARRHFLSFINETGGLLNICADNAILQNAGANSAFQLACALAHVNEYLHWLDETGEIGNVQQLQVTMATGTGFYEEIAKLRAFRQLLPMITGAYNIQPRLHLHIETSSVYRSRFDAYSNLLRDSIAGMAAVLGGADSLLILPFDEQLEGDHQFGKRMSRNQQLLFKEESYLQKVADISSGAYYIETLTAQLAAKAWEHFRSIEQDGGLIAAFEAGKINATVTDQASEWIGEYKAGKRILIGVNKYPNAADKPVPGNIVSGKSSDKGLKTISLTDEILNQ